MQVKLTKRTVDLAKPGTQDEFHWDVDMPGFGLKVTPKCLARKELSDFSQL